MLQTDFIPAFLRGLSSSVLKTFTLLNQKNKGVTIKVLFPGYIVIITSLLIGGVAYNTGNNLVFIVMSSTLSLIIVSGILSKFNLRKLSTSLECPATSSSGQETTIRISIDHRQSSIPVFGIGYQLEIKRIDPFSGVTMPHSPLTPLAVYFPQIPPRKISSKSLNLPLLQRGLYSIDIVRIRSGYPFGFFLKKAPFSLQKKLTLYPEIIPIDGTTLPKNLITGPQSAPRAGDGVDLLSIRDYHEGDPLRRIHWKASAKAGRYLTRELAKEQSPIISLFFPTQASAGNEKQRYERAISVTAGLCKLLLEKNFAVGLSTHHGSLPAQKTHRQFGYLIELLTRLPDTPEPEDHPKEKSLPHKTFYLQWQKGSSPRHDLIIDLRGYLTSIQEDQE